MTDRIGPPHPRILEEEIDAEIILYDPDDQRYVSLNETASDVWRLADGEMTTDEIVALLAQSYQIEPDSIRADVTRIIGEFAAAGLLTEPTTDE